MGLDQDTVHWEDCIYEANVDELCGVLARCPAEANPVLLVGHNPGVELLVRYLCRAVAPPPDGKLMPTGAVARLRMPDSWEDLAAGVAQLVDITRPRSLAVEPEADPHGSKQSRG